MNPRDVFTKGGTSLVITCSVFALVLGAAQSTTRAAGGPASRSTVLERVLAQEVQDEIGKSYWVRGATASNQVFCDAPDFPELNCESKRFGPAQSERFTIEGVSTAHPRAREQAWFRVRFESGRIGYLNADTLRSHLFVPMRHQTTAEGNAATVWELFFNERPEFVIARLQQRAFEAQTQAARAQEERMERGAVRLGMTKQQVLNSAWGTPERINVTEFGPRQREQWIYSPGTLYFEDGILTAVQPPR